MSSSNYESVSGGGGGDGGHDGLQASQHSTGARDSFYSAYPDEAVFDEAALDAHAASDPYAASTTEALPSQAAALEAPPAAPYADAPDGSPSPPSTSQPLPEGDGFGGGAGMFSTSQSYASVPGGQEGTKYAEQPYEAARGSPGLYAAPPGVTPPISTGYLSDSYSGGQGMFGGSAAQAYAPVATGDLGGDLGVPEAHLNRHSRPFSFASSHMLSGSASDYDSVHRLNAFDSSGRSSSMSQAYEDHPMGKYEKAAGGWTSTGAAAGGMTAAEAAAAYHADPRKDGLRRYGRVGDMSTKKKWLIVLAIAAALAIVTVAIVVPITRVLLNDDDGDKAPSSSDGAGTTQVDTSGAKILTSGGNGSVIQLADGSSFTYLNNFGGQWRSGLLDNGAQAQSYTPRLDEPWDFTKNRMLGVNFGGWFVIEPFIVPGLFEPYENTSSPVVDEWTLAAQWQSEGKLQENYRQHYDTFITEKDFADVAAAGLNYIRLPIGYWAIETQGSEPFPEGMAWEYFLKAIQWARKYGLRINLDLHAVPGSQNNYNHSGRLGKGINFLNSQMGMSNAQRTLNVIRTITQFISQSDIAPVVTMLSVLNEPNLNLGIGQEAMGDWYLEVYNIIRGISGTGAGKGPIITIHDGFIGLDKWSGFLAGGDRIAWDLHPYISFTPDPASGRYGDLSGLVSQACNAFGANIDASTRSNGVTLAGEWSLAWMDCGLYLNEVGSGARYDGSYNRPGQTFPRTGSCVYWDDWGSWNADTKGKMRDIFIAQADAMHNFFFWTWKIGNSLRTGKPVNPNWAYKLGLDNGWIPADPNGASTNACKNLQAQYPAIQKTTGAAQSFSAWMTGGASSYASTAAGYGWPPTSFYAGATGTVGAAQLAVGTLPSYTQTGTIRTAPAPTPTASVKGEVAPTVGAWANAADTTPMYTKIAGCAYPSDVYDYASFNFGQWPCSGSGGGAAPAAAVKRSPAPRPTAAPLLVARDVSA